MHGTGIILLLAAGVVILFGQGRLFVPVHDPVEPVFEIKIFTNNAPKSDF